MKKFENKYTIIRHYIREKSILYVGYGSLLVVFFIVFYLHHWPLEAFKDAALLSATFLILFSLYDVWHYAQKHKLLLKMQDYHEFYREQLELLPKEKNLLLEDYQQLLWQSVTEKEELATKYEGKTQQLLDYYGMWSHQIKTPLSALNLLVQSQESPNVQMKQELFKIDEYLSMMLHYLKMTNLEEDLLIETIDVQSAVKQTIRKFSTFFIQKNLSVEVKDFHQEVITDRKWFNFILEQIMFNAIKYTPSGGIIISWQENSLLIQDSGIGILPEDLPRIFDKGYTGYNGREDKKATGLGLHMSQTIGKPLGITFKATSEIGKGTTVWITFSHDIIAHNLTQK